MLEVHAINEHPELSSRALEGSREKAMLWDDEGSFIAIFMDKRIADSHAEIINNYIKDMEGNVEDEAMGDGTMTNPEQEK